MSASSPTATRGVRRVGSLLARLDARLAPHSGNRVFGWCLAVLAGAILLCYVVPLTPGMVRMHQVPTNLDYHAIGKEQGFVTVFWIASTAAYALALWRWRRGQLPGMRLLVVGAVLLNALSLLVPPVASQDVYTYSFYGVTQATYGDSPYASIPGEHPLHPWFPFWSWRDTSAVYGPPFMWLLRGVVPLAAGSMLAWVLWLKGILVALLAVGLWLLVRATGERHPVVLDQDVASRSSQDAAGPSGVAARGWPLLLLGWNPMVLQSVAMSAHVDAIMLAAVAGAVLAHRRGRYLVAFLLLTLTFLIKLYMGPLVALYGLWLALRVPARWRVAGRSRAADSATGDGGRAVTWPAAGVPLSRVAALCGYGLLALGLTVLAYLPFTGPGADTLLASVMSVGEGFSSGSPANIVRRALGAGLPLLGVTGTTAIEIGNTVARLAAFAGILALLGWCAWRLRPGRDPWPLLATWLTGYLLLTPWVFYWHLVPLLGLVAVVPWSRTSLVATVMSLNLVPLAEGGRSVPTTGMASAAVAFGQTLVGHVSRYLATDVTLWLVWRRSRRKPPRAEAAPARGPAAPTAPPDTVTSRR